MPRGYVPSRSIWVRFDRSREKYGAARLAHRYSPRLLVGNRSRRKYIQRVLRSLIVAIFVLTASSALAQFGHPLKGSWSGDWGPNKDQRTRVLMQMQWDGKAITGAINPGPNALPLTTASLDPETWQVHLEAKGVVIDGKLENIGSAHRVLSGTWTQAGQKGDFRLIRN